MSGIGSRAITEGELAAYESASADDDVFDLLWREWETREAIGLEEDRLREICELWFSKGIVQGLKWGMDQVDENL